MKLNSGLLQETVLYLNGFVDYAKFINKRAEPTFFGKCMAEEKVKKILKIKFTYFLKISFFL